ncbi:MAG: hypothetical protein EOM67_14025 [Spirochaetia bacterium]|nr:hypothetical protein [Spirochaetia bacterium]
MNWFKKPKNYHINEEGVIIPFHNITSLKVGSRTFIYHGSTCCESTSLNIEKDYMKWLKKQS